MIIFDDNELEVAMITYNRDEWVKEWFANCFEALMERNVNLVVYDSSTNDETKHIVEDMQANVAKGKLKYRYISSDVWVGHVVLNAILSAEAKYIWVVGDSRYHDFNILDDKVFPALKKDIDHVILHILSNDENDGQVYVDKNEMLAECFVSMTCTGLYIYKTSIFDGIKNDAVFRKECDDKYSGNYAFTWMGYFLECYARIQGKTLFSIVPVLDIKPEKKVQRWFKRFYECWVEDLCNLMDGVSGLYEDTEKVIQKTWKYLNIDSNWTCIEGRKRGGLCPEIYEKYMSNKMLERVTRNTEKLREYAYAREEEIDNIEKKWFELWHMEFGQFMDKRIGERVEELKKCNVCIYGAGAGGEMALKALRKHKIPVKCFYDRNAKEIQQIADIQVCDLAEIENDDFILVSMMTYIPVKHELIKRGVDVKNIWYVQEEW